MMSSVFDSFWSMAKYPIFVGAFVVAMRAIAWWLKSRRGY